MSYKNVLSLLAAIVISATSIQAQLDQQSPRELAKRAVVLMDAGKIDESISLLEEAQKLDPRSALYPYEIAYAYYSKKDFKTAIKYLEKLLKHKDADGQVSSCLVMPMI